MGKDRKYFFFESAKGKRVRTFKGKTYQAVDHNTDKQGVSRYASLVGLGSRAMARKGSSGEHHPHVAHRPDGRLPGTTLKKEGFGQGSFKHVKIKTSEFPEKNYIVLQDCSGVHIRLCWSADRKCWVFVKVTKNETLRSISYGTKDRALSAHNKQSITWVKFGTIVPSASP